MSRTGDAMDRVVEERRLTGVRGLLLVPPVVAAVYLVISAIALFRALLSAPLETPEGMALVVMPAVMIGLGAFAIWALLLERRISRSLMFVFFVLIGAEGFVDMLAFFQAPNLGLMEMAASLLDIAVALAMIGYFLRSMRVKLTLIN